MFDVAPDEIRIGPGAAARSLTRWVIRGVVPLTIAGLAAWGWYWPGAQSKPLEPRKVPGAVGALRMTVAPVALPGTGSWHTLTLPTNQPCTDLFLELGAQDAVDPVTLASLTVNSPIRCELALGRSSFLTESPVGFVGHPMMRTQPPLDPGWRASFAWADTIGSWTLLRRWPGLSLRDHVADP